MAPLANLSLVLCRPRFPENIGMAARACANMGCTELKLVQPERWNLEKMLALATPQAAPILQTAPLFPSLKDALADCQLAFGLTARIGGWRKNPVSPQTAAERINEALSTGSRVCIVLGPEDAGLTNAEAALCDCLVHIRAEKKAMSLNLAQAALIMLYECAKTCRKEQIHKPAANISHAERDLLEAKLRQTLTSLDCLNGKNTDYYFLTWHEILGRAQLKRHEFDIVMGFLRQLKNCLGHGDQHG